MRVCALQSTILMSVTTIKGRVSTKSALEVPWLLRRFSEYLWIQSISVALQHSVLPLQPYVWRVVSVLLQREWYILLLLFCFLIIRISGRL